MALTDKQEMFCREYLIDLNATQAAIRAGYSEKTANRIAAQLLSKLDIQNSIAQLKAQRNEQVNIDAAYVLRRLVEIDQMDVLDIMTDDNLLISSRMNMKTLADGAYVSPGEMIVVADTYDTNQQAGYIVARNGNNFDTSEQINFAGGMYVRVTDAIGNSTEKIRAYPRADTTFGFTAAVPNITLNIFDGYNVQSPSRYVIATTAEMEAMRWRVSDKKPNSDGTFSLTCDEYFDVKPDYNV